MSELICSSFSYLKWSNSFIMFDFVYSVTLSNIIDLNVTSTIGSPISFNYILSQLNHFLLLRKLNRNGTVYRSLQIESRPTATVDNRIDNSRKDLNVWGNDSAKYRLRIFYVSSIEIDSLFTKILFT